MTDLISRQGAINKCRKRLYESAVNNVGYKCNADQVFVDIAENRIEAWLNELPSAQPDKDMIHLQKEQAYMQGWADREMTAMPSAQPEELTCDGCKYEKTSYDLCVYCCRGYGDYYEDGDSE